MIVLQLRRELGASEETEHVIDWLLDAWSTLEMLRERFDDATALHLYLASLPLTRLCEREMELV